MLSGFSITIVNGGGEKVLNVNHHGQFDIADVKMSEIAAFTISTTPLIDDN